MEAGAGRGRISPLRVLELVGIVLLVVGGLLVVVAGDRSGWLFVALAAVVAAVMARNRRMTSPRTR